VDPQPLVGGGLGLESQRLQDGQCVKQEVAEVVAVMDGITQHACNSSAIHKGSWVERGEKRQPPTSATQAMAAAETTLAAAAAAAEAEAATHSGTTSEQ
jgi:hypothetical protein